jgi:hypothetical protein
LRGPENPNAALDIVVWLRSLGLGKYEAVFRENEIDETVLPNLTGEDLKDLYGLWVASYAVFNGDMLCGLAKKFLGLAEKKGTTDPLMIGQRLMGISLVATGSIAEGRTHLDRAYALYNQIAHAPLASRFGQDVRVSILSYRSLALWLLGYPGAALTDVKRALMHAREFQQAPALMYALFFTSFAMIYCGHYQTAKSLLDEMIAVADEKDALQWKANGMMQRGWILALSGEALADDCLWTDRVTLNRSYSDRAVVFSNLGCHVCGNRPI